jgi:hypothetical protein
VDVTFGFDHAVVIVPRISKAIEDYRRLDSPWSRTVDTKVVQPTTP